MKHELRQLARRVLDQRLKTVCSGVARAASKEVDDVEIVHKLRVAIRRALAAVDLLDDLLSPRAARRARRVLTRIRRAAGPTRDLDVLLERYTSSSASSPTDASDRPTVTAPMINLLLDQRRQARRRLRRVCRQSLSTARSWRVLRRLPQRLSKRRIRRAVGKLDFEAWARHGFRIAWDELLQAWPKPPVTMGELHRFRIRCKQLRYRIELVGQKLPAAVRGAVRDALTKLQTDLGTLLDHWTASTTLAALRRQSDDRALRRQLKTLIRWERRQADLAVQNLAASWNSPAAFASLLAEL